MVSSNGPELLMFSMSEMRQVRESSGRPLAKTMRSRANLSTPSGRNAPGARIVRPAAGEDDAVAGEFEHAVRTRAPDAVLHADAPVRLHGAVGQFGDEALIQAVLPQLVDRDGNVAAKLVSAAGGDADRVLPEFQLIDIRVAPSPGVLFHALERDGVIVHRHGSR